LLSHVWLRALETGKPVFTMLAGGLSFMAAAVQEVAKHF
jgi:hypothetical protein